MNLDGKMVATKILEEKKEEVSKLKQQGIFPKLVVFSDKENEASQIYIQKKRNACEKTGIILEEIHDDNLSEPELIEKIKEANHNQKVHGIVVQLPLPSHMNKQHVLDSISPKKDVDGLTSTNLSCLFMNKKGYIPCTPKGILRLLEAYHIKISGKHVVILGRSNLVGKPLAFLFLSENASVTILHSKSKNIQKIANTADILVSATGNPKSITSDMIKPGCIVIDVGIHRINGKIVGDVDYNEVSKVCSYITPVPKGVGPMTIAMLIENVIEASLMKK